MNKVIIMGRLTSDPRVSQTPSGVSACRFSVAVNRNFKNKEGNYDADFIDCVAWRQTADFISRFFKKGSMICVEGTLRNNNYQDKKYPEVTHYKLEVLVENAEFTGSKSDSNSNGGYQNPQYNNNNSYQSAPKQQAPFPDATNDSMSYGNVNDFEEILSDGDVPF